DEPRILGRSDARVCSAISAWVRPSGALTRAFRMRTCPRLSSVLMIGSPSRMRFPFKQNSASRSLRGCLPSAPDMALPQLFFKPRIVGKCRQGQGGKRVLRERTMKAPDPGHELDGDRL